MSKFHFIDDSIPKEEGLPKALYEIMRRCEEADLADDYGSYEAHASYLTGTLSKNYYAEGIISKRQWQNIERRYLL